jgi:hypothetical protein
MTKKIWEKVGSAQFKLASAILELLHDPFTVLFYRAFEQYWRKLRPAFFARNLLLCHALDRSDLCSDPCDPALFIRENRKPKHF